MSGRPEGKVAGITGGTRGIHVHTALQGGFIMKGWTNDDRVKMLWIIPGMILAIIGDYCMGIEPKDSAAVSFMISSGWLTIADWRIALSNIGGLVGAAFYTISALSFIGYLKTSSLSAAINGTVDF